MTQKEHFKKMNTDYLLSIRYHKTCKFPKKENDQPDFSDDQGLMWYIDKDLLFKELASRPHRIRAKSRRKI